MSDPAVTVIVPIRNEERFIEATVRALLEQDALPQSYEVLVVDGMSSDGTRSILQRLAAADPRLKILDNPAGTVPSGLNIGIAAARGDVLIRVDGHTTVARDFIRANLDLMREHPEAWCVGGPIAHRGASRRGKAIAAAMSSSVGVGGASHRFEEYEGYAESTAFPAFHRWVFDKIGTFDERLIRNQDDELSYRITKAGGQIFISPRVKHDYFVRDSFKALFAQYMQYGYWKIEVMRKHRRVVAPRHLVPGAFVLSLPLCIGASLLLPLPLSVLPALPLMAYGALLTWLGARAAVDAQDPVVGIGAAIAAATMHVAYGLGTVAGMFSRPGRGTRIEGLMSLITR
jgi:glycosyltransferase involved in cell wall biosynthesis